MAVSQVGLFDLVRSMFAWRTEAGHTETIFDARFAPHNSSMLVTASYDSQLKLWDVGKGTCIDSLEVGSTEDCLLLA